MPFKMAGAAVIETKHGSSHIQSKVICMQRIASRLQIPASFAVQWFDQAQQTGAFYISRECLATLVSSQDLACLLSYTEGDWFARLLPLNAATMQAIQTRQKETLLSGDPHTKAVRVEWGSGTDSGVLLVHFKRCKAIPSKRLPANTPPVLKPQGKKTMPHPAFGYLSLTHREAFCLHSNPVTSDVNFADGVASAKAACFFLLPMLLTDVPEKRLFYLFCKTRKIYLQTQEGRGHVYIQGKGEANP